jgi:5-formyltetrahydrofolate cyclo-ligase
MPSSPTTPHDKIATRTLMKARREALPAIERATLSLALADIDIARHLPPPPQTVSGFLPIGDEIDPRPLMTALQAAGYAIALPVVQGRGKALTFRSYTPGDQLDVVQWGLQEPMSVAPTVDPDILLVPLLAFDNSGNRLGYGAGHYDRSIAGLKARKVIVTIGVAFDQQRIDAVPHFEYDEPLDWVLTPSGLRRCR